MSTLSALQFLLAGTVNIDGSERHFSSAGPDLGADFMSCKQNQGDIDEPPITPTSNNTEPARAVQPAGKHVPATHAAMAEPVAQDAAQNNGLGGAVADGAPDNRQSAIRRRSSRSSPKQGER